MLTRARPECLVSHGRLSGGTRGSRSGGEGRTAYQDEEYPGKEIEGRGQYGKNAASSCVQAQVLFVPVGLILPNAGGSIKRPGRALGGVPPMQALEESGKRHLDGRTGGSVRPQIGSSVYVEWEQ